ncbi:MAG: UDP-N-acetyl-D-mannosamine dehydrogenase [Deltaproteobacteria bacterium]
MKICIMGLGYIGLPTAAMFATHGQKIIGVDINESIVNILNEGKIHIDEPYLDILVQGAVRSGNLTAKTMPEEADAFIIAVPTPITAEKKADMNFVINAAEAIIPYLRKGNIVILESTSPPGTVENILVPILKKSGLKIGTELFVAHSPERVLPGKILIEMMENNRIIGGINRKSTEMVRDLYKIFVRGEIFLTDATTAEMTKLVENTFRDVNIAFANELAKVCEKSSISVWEVINLANKHPRVNIHNPGPGVGGHCIAVDPWFLVESFPDTARLIKSSRELNDSMPHHVFDKIKAILAVGKKAEKKVISIMGITYKPNVDDIRESPIIDMINLLEKDGGYDIRIMDPYIKSFKYLCKSEYDMFSGSDLIVMAVNHDSFNKTNFGKLYPLMRTKNVLDLRNVIDGEKLSELGFSYYCLGQGQNIEAPKSEVFLQPA